MSGASAFAKINLALVVGPQRADGKHEVVTLLQRVSLYDDVALEPAERLEVLGFDGDTLVSGALRALARSRAVEPSWRVHLEKRIPVAAGLGGGSSDAAAALELGNAELAEPLTSAELHRLAAGIGADVPFFLREGSQLGTGDGTDLREVLLPSDYVVLLVLPRSESKTSTRAVYQAFDARGGARGFGERRERLLDALETVERPLDLARLPANDLASSPLATKLLALGAFRADVSGAGPAVYGLFEDEDTARRAGADLEAAGRVWVVHPV